MAIRKDITGQVNHKSYPFIPKARHPEFLETEEGKWSITVNLDPNLCPCGVCNHGLMDHCNPDGGPICECCSELCT